MFLQAVYTEFIKIAAKPRSYLGLAAITVLVGVILFAMKIDGLTYISFITAGLEESLLFEGDILNGNLMAFIILQMLIIHIPLLVALVTGDLISGEAAMGSLRMLATRPVTRSHDSRIVSGQCWPNQDCTTTTPIASRCASRNHQALTHRQPAALPTSTAARPPTTKTMTAKCSSSTASANS